MGPQSQRPDRGHRYGLTLSPEECRDRRVRLGMSVYQLARCSGLVERTVQRFEAGLIQPRPVTLVALRKGLAKVAEAQAQMNGARPLPRVRVLLGVG